MFKLTLSVSLAQPRSKTEGNAITEFTQKEFDVDANSDLRDLFTTRLYSTNYWKDGFCAKKNYLGMFGLTMDIDKGVTVDQAKEMFKDYNYIIHTSTSHRADLPKKDGIQDRFRVILPADPKTYKKYSEQSAGSGLYAALIKKYPFVDTVCAELARKYYPYLNSAYPQLFECYINDTGVYYRMDDTEVEAATRAVATKATTATKAADIDDSDRQFIHLDDEFILSDKVTVVKLRDIKEKTQVFCPFCDDINSQGISGVIIFTKKDRFHELFCSHCKGVHADAGNPQLGRYHLPLNEQFHDLFFIENKLYKVDERISNITIGQVPEALMDGLPNETKKTLKHFLARNRYFTAESFFVERKVAADIEKISWRLDHDNGVLDIRIPPIAVDVKDNKFINDWLLEIFPGFDFFVKKWLASYCYTNFRPMPILIINGPRGCGKSTFAEFVASMFGGVSQDWRGEPSTFTEYNEKRLLILDEANVDKKDQYTLFKSITGQQNLTVNKKYKAPYQVRNNLCLILLTNEPNPMFLIHAEKPLSDEENQFFMFSMDRGERTGLKSNIKDLLRERVGHYIRTELKEFAQEIDESGTMNSCRYTIPVPRTTLLEDQFNNAKSSLDYDCDIMAKYIFEGYSVKDKIGAIMYTIGPFDLVTISELQSIIDSAKMSHNNAKSFKERLITMGFLKQRVLKKHGEDAWEINPAGMKKLQNN